MELKVTINLNLSKFTYCIYILDEYVEQQLDHLNRESHQNGLQLTQIQQTVQSAVEHITTFLIDQVNFEAVHRDAMLKVHREELQEKQNQQVPV